MLNQVVSNVQHDLSGYMAQLDSPALTDSALADYSNLDHQSLMQQQHRQQESQENEISQLIKTVGNIKQLGKTIGGELSTDLKILEETEQGTDKNMSKMKRA